MNRALVMREAIQKIVPMISGKGVTVSNRGVGARVDIDIRTQQFTHVNVPFIAEDAPDEFLDSLQGFLDHEMGHIIKSEVPALLEAKKEGIGMLHNIVEDTMIERHIARRFPGSAHNITLMHHKYLEWYTIPHLTKPGVNLESLLFIPLIRAWDGEPVFIEFMKDKMNLIEDLAERLKHLAPDICKIGDSWEALAMARKIKDALGPNPPPVESPQTMNMEGEEDEGESQQSESQPSDQPEDQQDPPQQDDKKKDKKENKKGDQPKEKEADKQENNDDKKEEGTETADEDPTTPAGDKGEGESESEPDQAADTPAQATPDEETGEDDSSEADGSDSPDTPAEEDEQPAEQPEEGSGGADSPAGDDPSEESPGTGEQPGDESPSTEPDDSVHDREGSGKTPDEEQDDILSRMNKDLRDFDTAMEEILKTEATKVLEESDYRMWTTDFDIVEIFDPQDTEAVCRPIITGMRDRVDHMLNVLQKDLARAIAARSKSVWHPGKRSGRLHGSALSKLFMGDDRVFRTKEENRSMDVAVEIVMDCSGSMNDGNKMLLACDTAYGLSAVLDRMNIANEVVGFTTGDNFPSDVISEMAASGLRFARYEATWLGIFKAFSERCGPDSMKRFAMMPHCTGVMGSNVDGESVQAAAVRLSKRRETRKIMMVLSDGHPAAHGDGRQLRSHLKRTVANIMKSGIEVVGIGITDTAVESFYPKCLVINDLQELPNVVMKKLQEMLMK